MNRGRNRSGRLRLGVIIMLFSFLALGSFWVYEMMRRELINANPAVPRAEPDYYVEKFKFVRLSTTGQARYDIAGAKLIHYPLNDTYEVQQPVMNSHGNPLTPVKVSAERALVDHVGNKIHLYQNVQVDRPASATAERFHLNTEYLMVLPDEDVMQTDKEVALSLGTTRLTGIGMLINNATREFRLSRRVQGFFPPAAQTAPR